MLAREGSIIKYWKFVSDRGDTFRRRGKEKKKVHPTFAGSIQSYAPYYGSRVASLAPIISILPSVLYFPQPRRKFYAF